MYILRGAPASRNRATARMASALIIGWAFEVTALEEKLSVDACESPWQHERFEAALDPGSDPYGWYNLPPCHPWSV